MLNQSNFSEAKMNQILNELTNLKINLNSISKTNNLLYSFLFILILLNLFILMYAIFKIYLVQHNVIDYLQNFLKFHTRVILPSSRKSCSSDIYDQEDLVTSSKISNNLTMDKIDDFIYDYEYFSTSQTKEEYELPKNVAKAKFESTGYSKKNSTIRDKIDRRNENKTNIKKEKSNDSISLKMKRSESWDAKNKIYTK